jgi:hypothetical protein
MPFMLATVKELRIIGDRLGERGYGCVRATEIRKPNEEATKEKQKKRQETPEKGRRKEKRHPSLGRARLLPPGGGFK